MVPLAEPFVPWNEVAERVTTYSPGSSGSHENERVPYGIASATDRTTRPSWLIVICTVDCFESAKRTYCVVPAESSVVSSVIRGDSSSYCSKRVAASQ